MSEPSSVTELSPLDKIRKEEAEVIRQIVMVRERSDQSIANARKKAAQIKNQAQESGNRIGQTRHKEIVAKAEEEAQAINASAKNRSSEMYRRGQDRMDASIQEAVKIILGLHGSGEKDES